MDGPTKIILAGHGHGSKRILILFYLAGGMISIDLCFIFRIIASMHIPLHTCRKFHSDGEFVDSVIQHLIDQSLIGLFFHLAQQLQYGYTLVLQVGISLQMRFDLG